MMDNQKSSKGIITAIVIIVMLLVIMALTAFIAYILGNSKAADSAQNAAAVETAGEDATLQDAREADTEALIESVANDDEANRPEEWYGSFGENKKPDRSIDLEAFKAKCPDVYAWIEIPGTDIDYPIAYCEDASDPFWFTHDIDQNESDAGMIITDSMNAKDFSDPETLIYGQSPDDGTMFSQLALFRDADFFDEHEHIMIYMPDAQLVYRIYACYTGSSDHILVYNDFNDPIQFMKFFDSIADVRDLSMNIREDAKPSLGDHAIALVTHCGDETKRLFVHAVLEDVRY